MVPTPDGQSGRGRRLTTIQNDGRSQREGQSPNALTPITSVRRPLPKLPTSTPPTDPELRGGTLTPPAVGGVDRRAVLTPLKVAGNKPLPQLRTPTPTGTKPVGGLRPVPPAVARIVNPLKPTPIRSHKPVESIRASPATAPPVRRLPSSTSVGQLHSAARADVASTAAGESRRALDDQKVEVRTYLKISEL